MGELPAEALDEFAGGRLAVLRTGDRAGLSAVTAGMAALACAGSALGPCGALLPAFTYAGLL